MAQFKSLRVRITGESPLLLHNGQLCNPLNDWAKKIKTVTSKRKKTDADHAEVARLEWYGSMYLHDGKPCIPGEVIEGAIVNGAKKNKMGPRAKGGIYCEGNWPISNGGADLSNLEELWKSQKYNLLTPVKVGQAKIMRSRPRFDQWSIDEVEIKYDPAIVNESDVLDCLKSADGIGDWRPKFGRFSVSKI